MIQGYADQGIRLFAGNTAEIHNRSAVAVPFIEADFDVSFFDFKKFRMNNICHWGYIMNRAGFQSEMTLTFVFIVFTSLSANSIMRSENKKQEIFPVFRRI